MGRPKGEGKTPGSGRATGTPNKNTIDLQRISDDLGIHPFKILLHFAAGDWQSLGYKKETYVEYGKDYDNEVLYIKPETRMKAAAQAAEYLYPKRKSIEVIDLTPEIAPKPVASFTEFCEAAGYPKPYLKQIEMMGFCLDNSEPRLLLGARGYGKTDYITILGIAYDVYLNPNATNLIITKSNKRNASLINEIANALVRNGVELVKENSSCVRIKGLIGKDESVEAITIKTSMRGRHPNRVIMDDPVTEEDVSEAMRVLVKRKYDEVMKLCPNVAVIGQPAHKDDLYAHLAPMIKKMEVPHGSIPELDHDLVAQRLAGVDEASIQASYFLKILNQGSSPFDKIRIITTFPTGDSAVAFIDPSFEGGDYTAISIVKAYMEGVAVVGFTYKKAWNHCLDEISPLLTRYGVKRLCFETNSLGDQPLDILRTIFQNVGVCGKKSNTNKHSRIMSAGTYAHMIHMSKESDKTYQDQVIKYEHNSKYDDAPDSLASCLEWIGLIRGKK